MEFAGNAGNPIKVDTCQESVICRNVQMQMRIFENFQNYGNRLEKGVVWLVAWNIIPSPPSSRTIRIKHARLYTVELLIVVYAVRLWSTRPTFD